MDSQLLKPLWVASLGNWEQDRERILRAAASRCQALSLKSPWSNGFETSQVGKIWKGNSERLDRSQNFQNLSSRTLGSDLRQKLNNLAWPKLFQPRLKYKLRVTESTEHCAGTKATTVCSASKQLFSPSVSLTKGSLRTFSRKLSSYGRLTYIYIYMYIDIDLMMQMCKGFRSTWLILD